MRPGHRGPNGRGHARFAVLAPLLCVGALLTSCGSQSPASSSVAASMPSTTTVPTPLNPAAQAFSNVNWSGIVLPGQNAIPQPPLQKGGCAMEPLGEILKTSETQYVAYLSPRPGVDLAVLAAACSSYNIYAFNVFVYRANGTPQPTLLEVAYNGWFSNPADLTAAVPTAANSADGWHGFFLYRSMSVIEGGQGLAVDGVTFGPKGPTSPLSSAQMVPAEITFAWDGSYLVFSLAKNLATPTTGL